MNVLRVSATTDPTAAGGAREAGVVEIQALDARAVNQGVEAIGIVRSCLAASAVEVDCPSSRFASVRVAEDEGVRMRMCFRDWSLARRPHAGTQRAAWPTRRRPA
jgi:stage V sporulation protein SpoVS